VETGTELGKQAKPILARGEYLPDALMFPILADWLDRQKSGWVLDGFPRSLPQAVFLDHWLACRDLPLDAVVSLEVPLPHLIARIQDRVECPGCRWSGQRGQLKADENCPDCDSPASRRADDGECNFLSRHAEFVNLTQPVIERYLDQGVLSTCDATAPQDEVAAKLLRLFPALSA
jgi:adenylate kinase